jgi:hypothetical protein
LRVGRGIDTSAKTLSHPMGEGSVGLSPVEAEREERERRRINNRVADDVRRLILLSGREIRASLRRLLRLKVGEKALRVGTQTLRVCSSNEGTKRAEVNGGQTGSDALPTRSVGGPGKRFALSTLNSNAINCFIMYG